MVLGLAVALDMVGDMPISRRAVCMAADPLAGLAACMERPSSSGGRDGARR